MSSGSAGVGVAAAGRNASLSNDELLLESMQKKSALPILKYLVESVGNGWPFRVPPEWSHLCGLLDGLELDDGSGLCSGLSRYDAKPVLQPRRVLRVRREQCVVGRVSTRCGHEGALHGGVFGLIFGSGGRLPRGCVDLRKQRPRIDDSLIYS